MEEQEIDEWFEQEKEKLEAIFNQALATKQDPEKAKEHFDHAYRALIEHMQKKQRSLYEHQQRMLALQKPFARMREQITLFFTAISQWISAQKAAVAKWFFDQKIKRLLKQ